MLSTRHEAIVPASIATRTSAPASTRASAAEPTSARSPTSSAQGPVLRVALGVLGLLLGAVAWVWLRSLRVRVQAHAALDDAEARNRPWVLCFHHGRQFPLLAWGRRRETSVLVSHSRDGSIQARALSVLGLSIVRGSSSRGGARGLAAIIRRAKRGHDVAFAVDGPRGPLGVVKEGALATARSTGGLLIPMGSAARRAHVLTRAWDRFSLPWPFTRIAIVLGAPIEPGEGARERLETAIHRANDEAETCVA